MVISNYYYCLEGGYCTFPKLSLEEYATGKSHLQSMRFEADTMQTRSLSASDGSRCRLDSVDALKPCCNGQ